MDLQNRTHPRSHLIKACGQVGTCEASFLRRSSCSERVLGHWDHLLVPILQCMLRGMYDRFFLLKTSLSLILYLHWLPSAGELYGPRTKICFFLFPVTYRCYFYDCHFHSFKKNVIWRYNLRLWSNEGSRGINKIRSVPSSNTSARNGKSVIKLQENSKYNDIKVTDQYKAKIMSIWYTVIKGQKKRLSLFHENDSKLI